MMDRKNFKRRNSIILAVLMLGLFAAVWFWLVPGSRMTPQEISDYL
jgi:hypothetical protein